MSTTSDSSPARRAGLAEHLLGRLGSALLLLWMVVTVTFLLIHLAPGDPLSVLSPERFSPEHRERLARSLGLDRSLGEQYLVWLGNFLRGDWGTSFSLSRPVLSVITEALPATILLAFAATVIEYAVAIPVGVAAARRRGRWADRLLRFCGLALYSTPVFWLALMAILVFAYWWPLFPASHRASVGAEDLGWGARLLDQLHHLALPALVLGVASAGGTARFVRNRMIEVLAEDYIRLARAKGLSERRVVWRHGFRNALVPLVQLLGLSLPMLLNGTLVVEVVFSWPGLGQRIYQGILARDYPLILGTTVFSGALVILGNLLADFAHAAVDPRVRRG
ncbi:MAG: ABC transporter permease [Thermoanaerobaculia bacterium]|nr:ABC transporter permease [Thermoanaerobaculia bacterium]